MESVEIKHEKKKILIKCNLEDVIIAVEVLFAKKDYVSEIDEKHSIILNNEIDVSNYNTMNIITLILEKRYEKIELSINSNKRIDGVRFRLIYVEIGNLPKDYYLDKIVEQ
jgi:hypothetical protein